MCDQCVEIAKLQENNKIDLKLIQKLVDSEDIDLYAGNCYPTPADIKQ